MARWLSSWATVCVVLGSNPVRQQFFFSNLVLLINYSLECHMALSEANGLKTFEQFHDGFNGRPTSCIELAAFNTDLVPLRCTMVNVCH